MSLIKSLVQSAKTLVRGQSDADLDTPEQQEMNKQLDGIVAAYERYAALWAPMEADGVDYRFGRQTLGIPDEDGFKPEMDDQLGPMMEQEHAVMSQSRPKIICTALKKEHADAVKKVQAALQWLFVKGLRLEMLRLRAQMDGQTHGFWVTCGWWDDHARWNNDTHEWEGRMRVDLLPPSCFRADPLAETPEDFQGAYTERLIPVVDALRRWPEFKEAIIEAALKEREERQGEKGGIRGRLIPRQASGQYRARDVSDPLNLNGDGRLVNALNDQMNPHIGSVTVDGRHLPVYVTVQEFILVDDEETLYKRLVEMDYETLENEGRVMKDESGLDVDPETGEPYTRKTWPTIDQSYKGPRYPYGRHIIRFGNKVIVHDAAWDYERWPWTIGIRGYLPHTWRGQNGIERAKAGQDILNDLMGRKLDIIKNFSALKLKIREKSVLGAEDVENVAEFLRSLAGGIIKLKQNAPADAVDFLVPPAIPQVLVELTRDIEERQKDQTGVQDIKQGKGNSNTLGQDMLNETNARLRTALQELLMNDFTIRLMEQVWEICREHWSADDFIRIVGEDGSTEGMTIDPLMLEAEFEIGLEITAQMPFDRERRKQDAITIFQILANMGRADLGLKWLLEAYDVPNAQEIMQAFKTMLATPVEPEQEMQVSTDAESGEGEPAESPVLSGTGVGA